MSRSDLNNKVSEHTVELAAFKLIPGLIHVWGFLHSLFGFVTDRLMLSGICFTSWLLNRRLLSCTGSSPEGPSLLCSLPGAPQQIHGSMESPHVHPHGLSPAPDVPHTGQGLQTKTKTGTETTTLFFIILYHTWQQHQRTFQVQNWI